jgi:hypothetical protein
MSPAARKFEHTLNLPTIVSSLLAVKHIEATDLHFGSLQSNPLTVAHNTKISVNLLRDWMEFTHVLGNGILSKIS